MHREYPDGPAEQHRLRLGALDEHLAQNGAEVVLRERAVVAGFDLVHVEVLEVAGPVPAVVFLVLADPFLKCAEWLSVKAPSKEIHTG